MENDVTKLPIWAQGRIRIAEMRLREAEEKINTLFVTKDTDTFWAEGIDPMKPLPKGGRVRFCLGPRQHIDVRIEEGRIDVNGSDTVVVYPLSSNLVQIGFKHS